MLLPTPTWAQSGQRPNAFELQRKAVEARKQGQYAKALLLFRESHELKPTPSKVLNIAVCEEEVGQLLEARAHFEEALTKINPNDDLYGIAERHLNDLKPRIPKVTIALAPTSAASTSISLDDNTLGPKTIGHEMLVNPGRHIVRATAPNRIDREYVIETKTGESTGLVIDLPTKSPPRALLVPLPGANDPMERPQGVHWFDHRPSTILLGTGIVTGVIGLGVGASVLSSQDKLRETCSMRTCSQADASSLEQKEIAANVFLGVAGAAGLAGITMILFRTFSHTPSRVSVIPTGWTSGSVVVRF